MRRLPLSGGVRNPVTGRSDGYTGFVPCPRLDNANVPFESMLERDFIIVTQLERDLVRIVAQPMRLEVPCEGTAFNWIPDFLVERSCGTLELVEVKPVERVYVATNAGCDDTGAVDEAIDPRFAAMAEAARLAGHPFRLLTEREIRVEPRLHNAKMLYRYASDLFPMEWTLAGMSAIAETGADTIDALEGVLPHPIDAMAVALRLAWLGRITFDASHPIGRNTPFLRNGRAEADAGADR